MTAAESYIVAALLAIITAAIWLPSLWQQGNRRLDALLADTDADLDAQMVAACQQEWPTTFSGESHDVQGKWSA